MGLFGSSKWAAERKAAANRTLIASGIEALADQNLVAIRLATGTFSQQQLSAAAKAAFNTPIYFERTLAGLRELEGLIRKLDDQASRDNRHMAAERSFGAMLAYRLIASANLLLRAKESDWTELSVGFAVVEAPLVAFISQHAGLAWPVRYLEDFQFEEWRQQFLATETPPTPSPPSAP